MNSWAQAFAVVMLGVAVVYGFYVAIVLVRQPYDKEGFKGRRMWVIWIAAGLVILSSAIFSISSWSTAPTPDFSCSVERSSPPTTLHCLNRNQNVNRIEWIVSRDGSSVFQGHGNTFNQAIAEIGVYRVENIVVRENLFFSRSGAADTVIQLVARPAPQVQVISRPFVFKQFPAPGEIVTQTFDVSPEETVISATIRNMNATDVEPQVSVRDNRVILQLRGRGGSFCKITPFGGCLPRADSSVVEGVVELKVERRVP